MKRYTLAPNACADRDGRGFLGDAAAAGDFRWVTRGAVDTSTPGEPSRGAVAGEGPLDPGHHAWGAGDPLRTVDATWPAGFLG